MVEEEITKCQEELKALRAAIDSFNYELTKMKAELAEVLQEILSAEKEGKIHLTAEEKQFLLA